MFINVTVDKEVCAIISIAVVLNVIDNVIVNVTLQIRYYCSICQYFYSAV